ncbi:hypothetical protein K3177_14740 [Qipengyuania sp. GH25]|uniref:AMP-dependent synthetase/ligase domain-containing protein n=1 Tax=Qipengyuania pacifica TaxID=2860199 RepID=A0ABS7JK58_9SPHN|nr:hypothetical protein [Qipengyuania aerophila]MBX7489763.1 hypothetical protein [Qipengyuania aerophila]
MYFPFRHIYVRDMRFLTIVVNRYICVHEGRMPRSNLQEPTKKSPEVRLPARVALQVIAAGLALMKPMTTSAPAPEVPKELSWRLKQIQRQDWPATIVDDPELRRGYTVKQILRLVAAMAMLDAGLGPTASVSISRDNENTLLAIMQTCIGSRAMPHDTSSPRFGVLQPSLLRANSDQSEHLILPMSREAICAQLSRNLSERPIVVVDFGGIAAKAIMAWEASEIPVPRASLDAILVDGFREFRAGRGHVKIQARKGDRYASS